MVTNGSKNGDGTYTYSTDGTRGSLPCPFNQVIIKYTSPGPLVGWSFLTAFIVDGNNAPVGADKICPNGSSGKKTNSEFSWKYIPDTSVSNPPAHKASVTIKPNITSNAAQDKAGYKIYLTYVENSSQTNVPETAEDAAGLFNDGEDGEGDAEDEGDDTVAGAKAPTATPTATPKATPTATPKATPTATPTATPKVK